MSFSNINKLFIITSFIFIISCQENLIKFDNKNDNLSKNNKNVQIENIEEIDFINYGFLEENYIDYYTNENVLFNFLDNKLNKLKVNNYENKYKNNIPINTIYNGNNIFSINSKGEILKFNLETGKLLERIILNITIENKEPTSFSLIENDFIIGLKSGEVIRSKINGEIIWIYKKEDLLNTAIKIYDGNLVVLYSDEIVILSSNDGKVIFTKIFKSNNIIQSSGGKIVSYFNFLYLLFANSEFKVIDTFLFEEHDNDLGALSVKNSLNNLHDDIYVYQNLFLYLDNRNEITVFNISDNKYLLYKHKIEDIDSYIFFNNSIISKNNKNLSFYNIKNGNLFHELNIEKIFKKDSKIIKALIIKDNLHIFDNFGKLIILDKKYEIINNINLNIKNINKIFNYQNKILVSTDKGITYIF